MNRKTIRGILYGSLAAIIFGVVPLLTKELTSAENATVAGAMSYRFAACSLINALFVFGKKVEMKITRRQVRDILFLGSGSMVFTNILLVSSYGYTSIGMATVCHFFYPVAVCIIMRLLFREKFDQYKIAALICTITSLIILAVGTGMDSFFGMGIAVISGIGWATYLVSFEKAAYSTLDRSVTLLYMLAGAALIYFLIALSTGALFVPTGEQYLLIALCGIGMYFGTIFTAEAIAILGSSTVAFISLFEPITCVVVDYLFYHTMPHGLQWFGYLLMMASIIFVTISQTEKTK